MSATITLDRINEMIADAKANVDAARAAEDERCAAIHEEFLQSMFDLQSVAREAREREEIEAARRADEARPTRQTKDDTTDTH